MSRARAISFIPIAGTSQRQQAASQPLAYPPILASGASIRTSYPAVAAYRSGDVMVSPVLERGEGRRSPRRVIELDRLLTTKETIMSYGWHQILARAQDAGWQEALRWAGAVIAGFSSTQTRRSTSGTCTAGSASAPHTACTPTTVFAAHMSSCTSVNWKSAAPAV
jgi:hypothetical protein